MNVREWGISPKAVPEWQQSNRTLENIYISGMKPVYYQYPFTVRCAPWGKASTSMSFRSWIKKLMSTIGK